MEAAVDGVRLHYEVLGQGTLTVAMHGGLGLDHTYLRPWLDPLAVNLRVALNDHRGCGNSDREPLGHDFGMWSDDVDGLRKHLDAAQMILFGHAYGGFIAIDYASRYADCLRGLILCCTATNQDYGHEMLRAVKARGTAREVEAFTRLFVSGEPVPDDDTFEEMWSLVAPLTFKERATKLAADVFKRTRYSAVGFNHGEICLREYDVASRLARITVPTLVVAGRHDWVTPPEQSIRIRDGLAMATLRIMEGSGHWPFVEEHEQFVQVISEWVRSLNSN